jgi:hypothetical protein
MGSHFQFQARKARHPAASPSRRAFAYGSCVTCFAFLTGQSYTATLTRLASRFGYTSYRNATAEQLIASLDALEVERNQFLQRLSAFARHRITRKHRGQRAPTSAEFAVLYAPPFTKPTAKGRNA